MLYLLIALILFNLITNIFAIKTYTNTEFFEELYSRHWFLRIPYIIWYWLETLVRFKLIKDLLFILTTCIIGTSIIGILYFLMSYPTMFTIGCAIILATASIFLAILLLCAIDNLNKKRKKKKKKTSDNNKES